MKDESVCREGGEAGVCVSCEFLERRGFRRCLKESDFSTFFVLPAVKIIMTDDLWVMNDFFYFFRCTVVRVSVWNFKNLVGVFLCMHRTFALLEGFLSLS